MIHAAFGFSRICMKNADPYDANGSGFGRIRMMLPDPDTVDSFLVLEV